MRDSVLQQYESFPDPSPVTVPIDSKQFDRMDDNLHFGWSWSRYRYCYRRNEGLRILDAGCGTGLSTLALARLNPKATVVGVDVSPRALELARARAGTAGVSGVEFRAHDLEQPLPGGWGEFDYIVCRGVLGQAADPGRVLDHLGRALDHRGLLLVTFPSRYGRSTARRFRMAVDALAAPGTGLADRARIGLELFQALRVDHPIRRFETGTSGPAPPGVDRIVAGFLRADDRDWELHEAVDLLDRAGLQFLYTPTRTPWQAHRVFLASAVSEDLKTRVAGLGPRPLAELIEALDPSLHPEDYRIYACRAAYEPRVPDWVEAPRGDNAALDPLIPHPSGLSRTEAVSPTATVSRVVYQTVTGALGELDRRSDLLLRSVDGVASCGRLDQQLAEQTGVSDTPEARRTRWLELANHGFVLLEAPDPRQNVDCRHLGPILDRLDCPCPRRWVRACALHGQTTIDAIGPDDDRHAALTAARDRLGLIQVTACALCSDYVPES